MLMLMLAPATCAVRIVTGASLWSRSDALSILNSEALVRLGSGSLSLASFERLLHDRRHLLQGAVAIAEATRQDIEEARAHAASAAGERPFNDAARLTNRSASTAADAAAVLTPDGASFD